MKKYKKTIAPIASIVLAIILVFTSCVFADGSSGFIYTDGNGIEHYVDGDGHTHTYYDSYGNPISVLDAQFILNSEIQMSTGTIPDIGNQPNYHVIDDTYVTVNSQTYTYGSAVKVTPDIAGPATITYGISQTVTWSWSVAITASLKGIAKILLNIDFGIEIENSMSTQTTFAASFPVSEGKIGAVFFSPRLLNVNMTIHDINTGDSTTTTCHSPVYLGGGFADGLYDLVEW